MDIIRVLIVDDNFVARRGLRSYLRVEEDIVVAGEASTGAQAVEFIKKTPVDIVLMDLRMPDKDGISATAEIIKLKPATKVLMLTVADEQLLLLRAVLAGVVGYLVYGKFTPDELLEIIHRVASGENTVKLLVAPEILRHLQNNADKTHSIDEVQNMEPLTEREIEILSLIAIGKGNREIATSLDIKEKTVKNHISNLYAKLQIKSRYEAISYMLDISQDKPR